MTDEQKAAYIYAMSVAAQAEIAGMNAHNSADILLGITPRYQAPDFRKVAYDFDIDYVSLQNFFRD